MPRRDELSEVVGWIGTCTDIHDRKVAEDALQASEALARTRLAELQAIYLSSPAGLAFVSKELRYIRVNRALAQMNGISVEDHLGRTVEEVIGSELWKMVATLYQRVLSGETLVDVPVQGALPDAPETDRSWMVSYNPVRDETHEVIGISLAIQEFTASARAAELVQTSLKEAENERLRLQAVMRALPVGVAITNRQGGVEETNEAFERVWGGKPPPVMDVAGYRVYRGWWAETGKAVEPKEWASAIATESCRCVLGQLLEIERFDGQRAFVHNSAAPILDQDGRTTGSAVAILDLTELRAAQESLRRSEERFRQVFQHAATGIAISDRKGTIVQCNAAFSAIVGYGQDELRDRAFASLIHPDDEGANVIQHGRLATGELSFFEIENRYVHKQGQAVWVHQVVSSLRDDSGRPASFVALVTDISERVKVHAELRKREAESRARAEELDALMDAVPAITFIAQDPRCVRISGSRQTRELLRVPVEQSLSKSAPAHERPTTFRIMRDGRELPAEELPVQRAATTGKEIRDCELTLVFEDATTRNLLGNAVPLFASNGEVRGAVGAFIDITERKRAEEELKQRDEQFSTLIQNLPSGVALVDEQMRFTIYNSAFLKLFGISAEVGNANDQAWDQWKVFDEEGLLLPLAEHPARKAMSTCKPVRDRLVRVRRPSDGQDVWLLISVEPLRKPNGQLRLLICTYYDVTERKRAEEVNSRLAQQRQLALDAARLGWWHYDPVTQLASWDKRSAEIFGVAGNQRPNHEILKRLHPEDLPRVWSAVEQALNPREPKPYRWNIGSFTVTVLSAGSKLTDWRSFRGLATSSMPPTLSGPSRTFRTGRRSNRNWSASWRNGPKSLREAIAQMEEFSYTVSHDLRAPLRAMQVYSGALLEDYGNVLPPGARHPLTHSFELQPLGQDGVRCAHLQPHRANRASSGADQLDGIGGAYRPTVSRDATAQFGNPDRRTPGGAWTRTLADSGTLQLAHECGEVCAGGSETAGARLGRAKQGFSAHLGYG